jgi:hypothetical protein
MMSEASSQSGIPSDSGYENVQFAPCGHDYRMLRSKLRELGAGGQLDAIAAGRQLSAVMLHSRHCEDCFDERLRQERLCIEMDIEDDHQPCCGTCRTPLAYTGPRARDDYCSDRCYEIASSAAEEAAANRYI